MLYSPQNVTPKYGLGIERGLEMLLEEWHNALVSSLLFIDRPKCQVIASPIESRTSGETGIFCTENPPGTSILVIATITAIIGHSKGKQNY